MIALENIYKNYKKNDVLKGISFQINPGEIVGLLGPNGVGKTTLIKLLSGINNPNRGTIRMDEDVNIATVFDYNGLYSKFNAIENLIIFSPDGDKNVIEDVLKTVGLWEFRKKKVKTYSKGMMRKLTIARALLKNPNVLILDEPFDGLDIESRKYWIEFLKKWIQHKKTIIISSHIMSDIEDLCNRLLVIKNGKIVCDNRIENLKNHEKVGFVIRFENDLERARAKSIFSQCDVAFTEEEDKLYITDVKRKQEECTDILARENIKFSELYWKKKSLTDIYIDILGSQEEW
jgi:ABC-type multidrug transport system ATPase subunit